MRQAWRGLAALVAAGALATGASAAAAHDNGGYGSGDRGDFAAPVIFKMTPVDGAPEGVAFNRESGQFLVSRTGTGAIFAGRPDAPGDLTQFIAGFDTTSDNPPVATGMKVRDGLLYVAGASTGQIRIYDISAPAKPPVVFETGGGFINDLDLDRKAGDNRKAGNDRSGNGDRGGGDHNGGGTGGRD